jgi:hypothetical protein
LQHLVPREIDLQLLPHELASDERWPDESESSFSSDNDAALREACRAPLLVARHGVDAILEDYARSRLAARWKVPMRDRSDRLVPVEKSPWTIVVDVESPTSWDIETRTFMDAAEAPRTLDVWDTFVETMRQTYSYAFVFHDHAALVFSRSLCRALGSYLTTRNAPEDGFSMGAGCLVSYLPVGLPLCDFLEGCLADTGEFLGYAGAADATRQPKPRRVILAGKGTVRLDAKTCSVLFGIRPRGTCDLVVTGGCRALNMTCSFGVEMNVRVGLSSHLSWSGIALSRVPELRVGELGEVEGLLAREFGSLRMGKDAYANLFVECIRRDQAIEFTQGAECADGSTASLFLREFTVENRAAPPVSARQQQQPGEQRQAFVLPPPRPSPAFREEAAAMNVGLRPRPTANADLRPRPPGLRFPSAIDANPRRPSVTERPAERRRENAVPDWVAAVLEGPRGPADTARLFDFLLERGPRLDYDDDEFLSREEHHVPIPGIDYLAEGDVRALPRVTWRTREDAEAERRFTQLVSSFEDDGDGPFAVRPDALAHVIHASIQTAEAEASRRSSSRRHPVVPMRAPAVAAAPAEDLGDERTKKRGREEDQAAQALQFQCQICFDDVPGSRLRVVHPCGHACACDGCAVDLAKKGDGRCPMCRKPVKELTPLVLPKLSDHCAQKLAAAPSDPEIERERTGASAGKKPRAEEATSRQT